MPFRYASVVRARQSPNGAGSGEPALQGGGGLQDLEILPYREEDA